MPTPFEDLEAELADHPERVLVLAGAGVACATDNNPSAFWTGLLRNGLEYCHQRCHGKPPQWFSTTKNLIEEGTAEGLIGAAGRIEQAMRDLHQGEYGKWLAESVGKLKLKDRRAIDAILSWQVRIVTTNYDNLFEDASQLRPVVWLQRALALQVLRGDKPGILHLHGHFLTPDSVIFGAKSYEDICRDLQAQTVLRSVFTLQTIVFVGCGFGIDDPNFGGLMRWSKEALKNCQHRHFHLVRESELNQLAEHYQGLPITPVVYGKDYSDLSPFLEKLAEGVKRQSSKQSPLEVLTSTQIDFELQRHELANQTNMPTPEFVSRNFELARQLWLSGGRRTAALHFHSTLSQKGKDLTDLERIEFTLEAVEYLLDDGLEFQAAHLMKDIEKLILRTQVDLKILASYRQLLTRCLKTKAELNNLFFAIDASLPQATGEEKSRLEAERAELHLMCGDLKRAEQDVGVEGNK